MLWDKPFALNLPAAIQAHTSQTEALWGDYDESALRPHDSQRPTWEEATNALRYGMRLMGLDARGPICNRDGSIDWDSTATADPPHWHDPLAVL